MFDFSAGKLRTTDHQSNSQHADKGELSSNTHADDSPYIEQKAFVGKKQKKIRMPKLPSTLRAVDLLFAERSVELRDPHQDFLYLGDCDTANRTLFTGADLTIFATFAELNPRLDGFVT